MSRREALLKALAISIGIGWNFVDALALKVQGLDSFNMKSKTPKIAFDRKASKVRGKKELIKTLFRCSFRRQDRGTLKNISSSISLYSWQKTK